MARLYWFARWRRTMLVPACALLLLAANSAVAKPDAGQAKISDGADWQAQRMRIVNQLQAKHGITDKRVLDALRAVPRHLFVQPGDEKLAYQFGNLPIGKGQVIGDIYIVSFMTQALQVKPTDTVLEVGTGSGYQAAVLSKLVKKVYSIEIVPELARTGAQRLKKLGYRNVEAKQGDGYLGWPEHAPFDAIIVTSHPDRVPQMLIDQLKPGGHMVLPVGGKVQRMQRLTKTATGVKTEDLPLTGLVITGRDTPTPPLTGNPGK
jgi:protein-L-isoaspartate(D-aspartate) O-methyltransferase